MDMLDSYLADTNIFSSNYYGNPQTNTLSNSHGIGFEMGFQPLAFQDFGFGINYQFSYINRTPRIQYSDPIYISQYIDYKGRYHLLNEGVTMNITSRTYLNNLFDFETSKNKFIKRSILASEVLFGVGFTRLKDEIGFEYPYPSYLQQQNLADYSTKIQLSMLFGYELNEGSTLASINFKIGYQYFKSQKLRNKGNQVYNIYYKGGLKPMNLDFSGLTLGVVLMLRK